MLSDTLITDRFKRKLELLVFYVICAECIERADVKQLYPLLLISASETQASNIQQFAVQNQMALYKPMWQIISTMPEQFPCYRYHLLPCRCKPPITQVDQIMSVSANLYAMICISVQANANSGCYQGSEYKANCLFIKELIARVKFYDRNFGFYTSQALQQKIMGSSKACPQLASQSLRYIQLDIKASFTGIQEFWRMDEPEYEAVSMQKELIRKIIKPKLL